MPLLIRMDVQLFDKSLTGVRLLFHVVAQCSGEHEETAAIDCRKFGSLLVIQIALKDTDDTKKRGGLPAAAILCTSVCKLLS